MLSSSMNNDNITSPVSTSLKKKVLIIGLFCIIMTGLFIADNSQQERFATLRYGYSCMNQGQYGEAIPAFENYLNVDSDIYWYLIELINDKSYSRENVIECLEKCLLQTDANQT